MGSKRAEDKLRGKKGGSVNNSKGREQWCMDASSNPFRLAASERLLARVLTRAIPRTLGNAGASGRRDGGRPGLAGWQAGKGRRPFALSPPDEFRLYARPDVT